MNNTLLFVKNNKSVDLCVEFFQKKRKNNENYFLVFQGFPQIWKRNKGWIWFLDKFDHCISQNNALERKKKNEKNYKIKKIKNETRNNQINYHISDADHIDYDTEQLEYFYDWNDELELNDIDDIMKIDKTIFEQYIFRLSIIFKINHFWSNYEFLCLIIGMNQNEK